MAARRVTSTTSPRMIRRLRRSTTGNGFATDAAAWSSEALFVKRPPSSQPPYSRIRTSVRSGSTEIARFTISFSSWPSHAESRSSFTSRKKLSKSTRNATRPSVLPSSRDTDGAVATGRYSAAVPVARSFAARARHSRITPQLATAGVLAAVPARIAAPRPHHPAPALGALHCILERVEEGGLARGRGLQGLRVRRAAVLEDVVGLG